MAVTANFIWVGQGDCTLIKTEDNTVILLDCGTSDSTSIYASNVKPTIDAVMTAAGKTQFDYLILTHSDKDHCNLIPSLYTSYTFNHVYYGGAVYQYKIHKINLEDKTYFKNLHSLGDHFLNIVFQILNETACKMWIICGNYPYKKAPPAATVGTDVNRKTKTKALRAIYDNNGNSLIVVLNSNDYRMAFLGDATKAEQAFLYDALKKAGSLNNLNCKSLKLSHHGSKESYNEDLTSESLKPPGVFASAGITFGHPDEGMIDGITTIVNTAAKHKYVVYDEAIDNDYVVKDNTKYVYNTNNDFGVSAIKVPKKTKSGKKSRNKHAGEPYTELYGENILLTITAGVGAITRGTSRTLLTTKSTLKVASPKKRRRKS